MRTVKITTINAKITTGIVCGVIRNETSPVVNDSGIGRGPAVGGGRGKGRDKERVISPDVLDNLISRTR